VSAAVPAPVLAAGAVCWRERRSQIEILLISRKRHTDISLPKGKVEPGETIAAAAVREVREETGYRVVLGAPLGLTEYILPSGRDKVVHYWAAEVPDDELRRGHFRPTDEVQSVEWVRLDKAAGRLTYERDQELVQRFAEQVAAGHVRTFAMIVLRHARADHDSPDGSDAARPLTESGKEQARALVAAISPWRPGAVVTSPAKRCRQTVKPLATALGIDVKTWESLAQDAWERPGGGGQDAMADLRRHVAKRLARTVTTVLCTHTPVLPAVIDAITVHTAGEQDRRTERLGMLSPAEFSVLHFSTAKPESGVLAAETYSPA